MEEAPAQTPPVAAAKSAPWGVLERRRLGGAGGWDYLTLDAEGRRLYVSRGDRVEVFDTATELPVGTIANTQGVHGVALNEVARRGYTSNGRADSVSEFDLDTLAVLRELPVSGHNPDAILYEPVGGHILTFNGRSKDVTVLDAQSGAVLATLQVPDKPEFAVDDGAGRIYVNIESPVGRVAVIDARRLQVTAVWELPGCATPTGLAMDRARRRLFSVCDGGVMAVTDADDGRPRGRVNIGEGPDAAAYDPVRRLVFSSNGAGSLTVVHQDGADRYRVLQTLATQPGARTMALDSARGRIYLVTADFAPAAAQPAPPHSRPQMLPESFTLLVVGRR